jgi:hypothetical protein
MILAIKFDAIFLVQNNGHIDLLQLEDESHERPTLREHHSKARVQSKKKSGGETNEGIAAEP